VWSDSDGKFVLTVQAAAEASAPSFSGGDSPALTMLPVGGPTNAVPVSAASGDHVSHGHAQHRRRRQRRAPLPPHPIARLNAPSKATSPRLSWDLDLLDFILLPLIPLIAACTIAAAMLFPILLAAAAGTTFACSRRYSRGQPLLPGIVKTAAHPPSVPRSGSGLSGFTSLGSECLGTEAPPVSADVRMPLVAPRPGLVASSLLGNATPARGTGTYTAPTPHGGSAALTPSGPFTPEMAGGDAAPERSAAVTVERLRARLAEARRVQGGE
jgi:hypothetical protein